jgi:basic membrane protein A and related proteins
VHRRTFRAIAIALTLAVSAFGVAACGGDDEGSGGSSSATTQAQGKSIKVGIVTDIGGLNDRSFNALANKGLQDAIKQLGVEGRVLISKSNADYVPNLTTLAQQKYDLVVGIGFLMADAVNTVATKFPQNNFAIVDQSYTLLKAKPKNVQGLLFAEQEAGYLVGYLSGLYAKDNGGSISTVGGQKIPPVDHYIAGFQAGAEKADPGVKTLNGYSQDFVDQAKCKEIALDQIARGSKVVFHVAGQCGLGAIDAAKEKSVQGIGVDADQA